MAAPEKILVIKLSALGDVVQALGPMKAIRRHHGHAHIVLLTTPPYADFFRASGLVDEIWDDGRPKGASSLARLVRRMRHARFARVYDLQTSSRTNRYFHMLRPFPPEWSGTARGASHPHANPQRDSMNAIAQKAEQLQMAGIADVPPPDLDWVEAEISRFKLPERFALIVPGGSAHRPEKRWPALKFAGLARHLIAHGTTPVVLGHGHEEQQIAQSIAALATGTRDLVGQTSFLEIAALARKAALAVGNDTGPMHIAAVAGAPSVVLFSHASDPELSKPHGAWVRVLRRPDLKDLTVDEVIAALPPA